MKKRLLCLVLAGTLAFSVSACGTKDDSAGETTPSVETEATVETETVEESQETVAEETETEAADGLSGILSKMYETVGEMEVALGEPMPVELANVDSVSYYLGLTSGEGIEEAIFSEPMMSSVAYSVCLVRAAEGADVESLKQSIFDGVDARKWLCVGAENVTVASSDNVILLVMASEDYATQLYDAFCQVTGSQDGEKLSRAGE